MLVLPRVDSPGQGALALDRCFEDLSLLHGLLGVHAGRLLRLGAVTGSLLRLPDDPTILSACVVPRHSPLRPLLTYLGEVEAGIDVRFWIDPCDAPAAEAGGLYRWRTFPAMEADTAIAGGARDSPMQVDSCLVGAINDAAYGFRDGRLTRILGSLPPERVMAYGTRAPDGRVTTGALAIDVNERRLVEYLATRPQDQRRGHASLLVKQLVGDARRRGCTTVGLRASPEGARLYARLGFRTVAHVDVWRQGERPH